MAEDSTYYGMLLQQVKHTVKYEKNMWLYVYHFLLLTLLLHTVFES